MSGLWVSVGGDEGVGVSHVQYYNMVLVNAAGKDLTAVQNLLKKHQTLTVRVYTELTYFLTSLPINFTPM